MRGPVRRIGPDLDRELQNLAATLGLSASAAGERLARLQRTLWTRGWNHADVLDALGVVQALASVAPEQIAGVPDLLETWGQARRLERQARNRVKDARMRGVIFEPGPSPG